MYGDNIMYIYIYINMYMDEMNNIWNIFDYIQVSWNYMQILSS